MAIEERTSDMRGQEVRRMCVLPDSHVGGTTITTYSSIYTGGTNILTYRFQPEMTLEAIQKWGATWMGGVPTMYRMMWALPDYDSYDISSLRCVYYAGAGVDKKFLVKLSSMAPHFGTNLGMTECAGVSTYTPMPMTVEVLLGQVGRAAEDIARISIRGKMNSDGTADDELPLGEIGEICYHPPLVFKGYFGQPEETAYAISKEGILYTGDIGCFKDMGTYQGLFLMGRSKSMIKQKGYNVFPDEIALYISQLASVAEVEVIGLQHDLFDEAVFAFIIPEAGKKLTSEDVMTHCKGIASYKRPQHIEILADGSAFPVNKNGKVDKPALSEMAKKVIEELRKQKKWDAI
jgi:acyl-CoA synthetase (AMP-forming)/AMP-acid ligase II